MSLHDLYPAADGTHHVRDGRPAYAARFDEVQKFHPPGLAPVRRGDAAWHVDPRGEPAYERRFRWTFGFYEGLAAVADDEGWRHIRPDGSDVYPERYAFCGNFQEGRAPVRDAEGRYRHIDDAGASRSPRAFRYAGDFRDGIAVVQAEDGRSTHVTLDGALLHGKFFEDLDIFHKGLARARDEGGWTHVDRSGRPTYSRRFAMVEPFYNGQARVEGGDGALEVIAPDGSTLVELRPPRRSDFAALSSDLVGVWRTETIAAAVELGVAEALPGSAEEIAARCGLSSTRAPRLLRALEELGLVTAGAGTWQLTARGAHLTRSHPFTLANAAVEYARRFPAAWSRLPEALQGGAAWTAPDVFAEVAATPADVQGHHRMLESYARHDYAAVPEALGLSGAEVVIDAGGGLGVLAAGILRRHPGVQVVLLDRPEVVALVDPPTDVRARITVQAADIFGPWPACGDAVLLSRVLHDWDDDRAIQILRHARAALTSGGRVYVVEMVLPERGGTGGMCDLHLLVVSGGQERTRPAYAQLFDAAALVLREVRPLPALPSILVGEAR